MSDRIFQTPAPQRATRDAETVTPMSGNKQMPPFPCPDRMPDTRHVPNK